MVAAVDVQIDNVSYVSTTPGQFMVDFESVSIDLDIAAQQPRAQFDVWIWNKSITRPKGSQEVIFYNAEGGREFGGIILQVTEQEVSPTLMIYHCNCGDWTKWFDAHIVVQTFGPQTASTIAQEIVSTYVNVTGTTRLFTTNNIQTTSPDPVVPLIQFAYMTPSQCIGQLTQMLGWGFYLDEYRDVNFYRWESFLSPLPGNILNADDLYNDPSLSESQVPDWINLQITEDISQIKNRVYITGIYVAQSLLYSETHTGDGNTTTFSLNYQAPQNLNNIAIDINGNPVQVGMDLLDSVPGGPCEQNTAYVNFSAQTVRFCTAPTNGAVITIKYYPMTQQAVMEDNTQAINYLKARDGTDGVREYNRLDPSLSAETPALAQGRAQMTLNKYAYPYKSLRFTSYLQSPLNGTGWRPGQAFTFQSLRRFDGELNNTTFYVVRVSKKLIKADPDWMWVFTIDAASIPYEI
ncbi:MAG: hypothetical protein ACYCOR_10815 [Acidobacteriaceae bacterium]